MTSCQKKYGRDARIVVVFFALFFFCFPKIVSLRNMTAERRRRKRLGVFCRDLHLTLLCSFSV